MSYNFNTFEEIAVYFSICFILYLILSLFVGSLVDGLFWIINSVWVIR